MSEEASSSLSKKPLFPKKRKRDAPVETVVASTGFPISNRKKRAQSTKATAVHGPAAQSTTTVSISSTSSTPVIGIDNKKKAKLLDWHQTAKEVRRLGATAFVKQQKRAYQDEEYYKLTGRQRKQQSMPLPMVRGIRKKAAAREAAAAAAAKAAGRVLPQSSKQQQNRDKKKQNRGNYGPAPSIGFVKKGVLQLKRKPV